jgi:hypothetical protein
MTELEQYQIIGKLVSDLGDAKKRLAMLHAKAETLAHGLHAMADVLTGNAKARFEGTLARLENSRVGWQAQTLHWPAVDELRDLLQDIEITKSRLASLERQCAELGVSH